MNYTSVDKLNLQLNTCRICIYHNLVTNLFSQLHISFTFSGKDGTKTSKLSLGNDFQTGKTQHFEVSGHDVGDVAMITLNNDGFGIFSYWYIVKGIFSNWRHIAEDIFSYLNGGKGIFSDWYIAKVIVEKLVESGTKKYEFPCYRWVVDHLVVYEGTGKLTYMLQKVDRYKKWLLK